MGGVMALLVEVALAQPVGLRAAGAGAVAGLVAAALVAHWLRFYWRNNRFRTIYPLALPLSAFLMFFFTRQDARGGELLVRLHAGQDHPHQGIEEHCGRAQERQVDPAAREAPAREAHGRGGLSCAHNGPSGATTTAAGG